MSVAVDTHLIAIGQQAWRIEAHGCCLGELRRISRLFVLIPVAGSPLDDVKGGYGSRAAAMLAITERTGGACRVRET